MKFEFRFPDIGEGIAEGTVMKWLVKEGEDIEEGQSVAEIETDKVTTEIPSPRKGKVLELKAEEGDVINVGDIFITIDSSGATDEVDIKDELPEKNEVVEEETAGVVGEVIASSEEIPPSTEGEISSVRNSNKAKVLATPVARKMAKDLDIDISKIEGTGPKGRVMKEDIIRAKDELSKPSMEISIPKVVPKRELIIEDERVERSHLLEFEKLLQNKWQYLGLQYPILLQWMK